jgi:GTP-binding protein
LNASTPDPLVIRHLEYLGPMALRDGWRPTPLLPEVAFVGRSNVGKSSLLNRLVRRKAFARVSTTPGRTREIHFFEVNRTCVFVDLPGYGYARISKARKAEWKPLIEGYLTESAPLRAVVLLLDARHTPTDDDLDMLDFLAEIGVPVIVAATKVDKLKPRELAGRLAELSHRSGVDSAQIIPFSATTGVGRDDLASAIVAVLAAPSWRQEALGADGAADAPPG